MFLPVSWLRQFMECERTMSSSKCWRTYLCIPQILRVGGFFPYFWVRQIVSRMLENLRFFFLTEGIALLIRCFYRDFPLQETFGEYSSAAAIFSLLGMHTEWRGNRFSLSITRFLSPMSLVSIKRTKYFLMISFRFCLTRVPRVTSLNKKKI